MTSDLTGTGLGAIAAVAMRVASGLEFRNDVMMDCDDDFIPLSDRIAAFGGQVDLEGI